VRPTARAKENVCCVQNYGSFGRRAARGFGLALFDIVNVQNWPATFAVAAIWSLFLTGTGRGPFVNFSRQADH